MVIEQRPRRSRRKGLRLVLVGCLLVGGIGVIYPLHWLLNPWSAPGRPDLVGYWQGEVTYGSADTRTMVLHLTDQVGGGDEGPEIDGGAKVCAGGQSQAYEIYGDATNYRGTRFSLHARRSGDAAGLYLGQLVGTWDGRDGLTVSTELIRIDSGGVSHSTTSTDTRTGITTSDTPTIRFELRRAAKADYATACR